ncbi:MAG: hypothetical protein MJ180_04300, partial [Candidatus Gastranaerophilales bacterium]|nr:hypothetical protein [Candidatus Gastranaerophilales bacterium]
MLDDIDAMAFPDDLPSVINTMKIVNDTISNIGNKEQKTLSVDEILSELGIVLVTSDGQKIAERLNALPKEALAKISNPKGIKDLLEENGLEINFDNISTVLELSNHITLRTPEEIEETESKRETVKNQVRAQDLMIKLFLLEASWNDQYTDSVGPFGQFAEGVHYLTNKTIGEAGLNGEHSDIIETIRRAVNIFEGKKNHYQLISYFKECAQRAADLKILNPEKFKEGFKDIQGEYSEKYGISYKEEAFKKLFEVIDSGKAQNPDGSFTDEYKNAIRKAINIELYNPNTDTMNIIMNGLGETILMLGTLGWSAETRAGQVLAQTSMNTFNRLGTSIASTQVKNQLLKGALRLTGKGVSLIGPMLNEGTKMYTYSAITGTGANVTDTVIKGDYENFLAHQALVMSGANGSFVFGAFAGGFGSAVTQKVTQFVSKTSSKVATALGEKFAKGAVNANEVYATILEKSVPTKIAEVAAFATDVLGFTGFEVANKTIETALDKNKDVTVDEVVNLLKEEFQSQGMNLGQIKVVSHLLMWMKGARSARNLSMNFAKENIPQLDKVTVEKHGEGYNLNCNGIKIECKNANDMISSLHLIVRGQYAFDSKFDGIVSQQEAYKQFIKAMQESQIDENTEGKSAKEKIKDTLARTVNLGTEIATDVAPILSVSLDKLPAVPEAIAKVAGEKLAEGLALAGTMKSTEKAEDIKTPKYTVDEKTINDFMMSKFHKILTDVDKSDLYIAATENFDLVKKYLDRGIKYGFTDIVEAYKINSKMAEKFFLYGITNPHELRTIVEADSINREAVKACLEHNIGDCELIKEIALTFDKNSDTILECFKYGIQNTEDIKLISECKTINEPLVKKLLSAGIKSANSIDNLVQAYQINPDFVKECINKYKMKNSTNVLFLTIINQLDNAIAQKYLESAQMIYSAELCNEIVKAYKINHDFTLKFVKNYILTDKSNEESLSDVSIKRLETMLDNNEELFGKTEFDEPKSVSCDNSYDIPCIGGLAKKYAQHQEIIDLCITKNFSPDDIVRVCSASEQKPQMALQLIRIGLYPWNINKIINNIDENNPLLRECLDKKTLPVNALAGILIDKNLDVNIARRLVQKIGIENANNLRESDFRTAIDFIGLAQVKSINEIKLSEKKELLKALVASNTGVFEVSEELRKCFPLVPKNQEEYCAVLPQIGRSLGIETKTLETKQISVFNNSMDNLGQTLSTLSTQEFADLKIAQEFSEEDFIKSVLEKTKDLPETERQKVFDYFGFELHHNINTKSGYSILGYPVNLNNGEKLAQIESPLTKAVVESLRPDVIRYSEQKVKVNNPHVEKLLNEVLTVLPEMQSMIGRYQHGTHQFDVMKHSLKVVQKISQDVKFQKLNNSDKKIILLAAMLHDITKTEGSPDPTHATEGSFDTFFIAKKFNLTKEEEIKLYKLIRHHEWLGYVNSAKNQKILTKRLQSVAFDLQQDNLFDMSLIFTHADLKSVKVDDSFHDNTGYGKVAETCAERIKEYVAELQTTQPLLPVTKLPKSESIKSQIKQINSDGSTNIKGVYIDKDGLVIIKYNEVENWEDLGFPKGTISRGISAIGYSGESQTKTAIDTGNIKFFVHGLTDSSELAKFDAFSLVDSDTLLSASYAERPESKYRFFRPQGVLLDVDTKYIHGGLPYDFGSKIKKDIKNFKEEYLFGGKNEEGRLY